MASQWPPRSPHDAQASTPGGRERLRRLALRTSPSPSPSRIKSSRVAATALRPHADDASEDETPDLDDDDDEETLQLKLQAIQAKLKLKKLQAAKTQKAAAAAAAATAARPAGIENMRDRARATPEAAPSANNTCDGMREVPLQSRLAAARERMERSASQAGDAIQVPASPAKKTRGESNDVDGSPKRVLLGIDKGLKAADVSLRRAPSLRRAEEKSGGQQGGGGYLRRANSSSGVRPAATAVSTAPPPPPRPISFNERLAAARSEEVGRQEKEERIRRMRSTAFSIGQREMEQYKSAAVDLPDLPEERQGFSREEIINSTNLSNGGGLQRSNTASTVRPRSALGSSDSGGGALTPPAPSNSKKKVQPADVPEAEASSFEPYSGLHLSKRIIPHQVLTRAISGKKSYLLKDLLRYVKAPNWSLPNIEQDIVVLAIVASKSDPRSHKPGPGAGGKQQDRGKYMVLTLVDLSYEVELFLFNSGFDRFWRMTTGTVVAILNPTIMPPPPGREATGRFSLVINSDADTILEIGNSRDLGFCKSVKKDGQPCNSWVNAKRTEHCEFHTNEAVRKVRGRRMELNGMDFGGGRQSSKGGSHEKFHKSEKELKRGNYDRETQSRWFVSGASQNAGLLDDEREGGFADRAEREEVLKRRLSRMERERDIAKRLGEMGGGAGKEYMSQAAASLGSSMSSASSAATGSAPTSSQNTSVLGGPGGARSLKADARALGLVAPKGEQPKVDLGPIKRKRPESSLSSSTATGGSVGSKSAMGWGSSLKNKLAQMREGENLDTGKALLATSKSGGNVASAREAKTGTDKSPVRKKTRFVTDKGIREAGRESLGEPLSATSKSRQVVLDGDDDDDDLIVLK